MIDLAYDDVEVPFGKYRGYSLSWIAENDLRYLDWLATGTDWGSDYADLIEDVVLEVNRKRVGMAVRLDLTDHQNERLAQILFAVSAKMPIVRLEGGAGVGKTAVTGELAAELMLLGYRVRAMAVSYVATQVLAKSLARYKVQTATVAKMLGFTKSFVDGVEVYAHSSMTPRFAEECLKKKQALIVDECSMISDRDAKLLFETVRECGGLLVLVGDSRQLHP